MRILDFYPSQGSYSPGEAVTFFIELESFLIEDITLRMIIRHLADQPVILKQSLHLAPGPHTVQMPWTPPARAAGYAARLELLPVDDFHALHANTAFDVLAHWTEFPRYGFLTDFSAGRADPDSVLKTLARFHLNGLQFYDWQYRHDQLLAPTGDYIDPLGRELSLASIRRLVDAAHRHGMAAMPYLAIYAASADFWRLHPEWALYNKEGQPIPFGENFLGLMDPSMGGPWSEHLLAEGARAQRSIPFDGLHIDQYGDPKQAWDSQGKSVDLPRAFVDFVQAASDQDPDKTILFNAVGNWPIEALAESAVDFLYIEVWPPDVEYRRLAEIVLNAVRLSRGKAVVIALYLPADRPANNLLTDAVILASGGTRIELGEDARLLCDPYFPKHETISNELQAELQRFYDFMVRNGEWLRPYTLSLTDKEAWASGQLNPDFIFTDECIMTVVRRHAESLVIQLVNFSGLTRDQRWDEPHAVPTLCRELSVQVQMTAPPSQVFWDCPERMGGLQALPFEYANGTLTFHIPQIHIIGLVAIHE